MKQQFIAIATLMLIHASAAFCAEASPNPRLGVFAGSIGKARVQVCISHASAQYFYMRHRAGIRLELVGSEEVENPFDAMKSAIARGELDLFEATGAFGHESEATGFWTLDANADGWSGEWRDPADLRRAPIRLTRLPGATGELVNGGECPAVYFAPLRDNLQISYADANFDGHAYRTLTTAAATAMALPDGSSAARSVNAASIAWLKQQAVFGYECSVGNGGGSIALERTLQPIGWTDHYLVQEDSLQETYCGGAHGDSAQSVIVWDLAKAQTIDTWNWIQDPSLEVTRNDDGEPHRSTFRELLNQHHPRNVADDACAEFVDDMTIAPPYPSTEGLVFPTIFFYAMRVCGDPITLSWSAAEPHLSEAGKAVMKHWTK